MTTNSLNEKLSAFGADGYISAEEVLALRRDVFADGVVSAEELDAMFALGERAPNGDREWRMFFSEVLADFYLREEEPQGYFTPDEFSTLRERITRDDDQASQLELNLLVELIEKAKQTAPGLSEFTADQFRRYFAKPDTSAPNAEETALVKRFIFAAGGAGHVAVTRPEAELIFDINDAVRDKAPDPAWADLFVTAIVNHLKAHIGYSSISRDHAISLETEDPDDGPAHEHTVLEGEDNIDRSKSNLWDMVLNVFATKSAHRRRVERRYAALNATREDEARKAEIVTDTEADWLADRIDRDGDYSDNERALINRLREFDDELPANLRSLVDRAT